MKIDKATISRAAALPGFESYQPEVDVPALNRPRERPVDKPGEGRIAAVLVLIFDAATGSSADPKLILTKRQAGLSNHGGQISFPGGRREGDESLWNTATRETFEEVGVDAAGIELVGQLNPVYIPPSDFTVNPFIGWHAGRPKLTRCENEVAEIIEVGIDELLDPKTLQFGDIESASGMNINVPFYAVGKQNEHRVWGATAIVLGELIQRIRLADIN